MQAEVRMTHPLDKLKYFKAFMAHTARAFAGFYAYPCRTEWDALLQRILKEGSLVAIDEFTAKFQFNDNEYEIWIANRWYAFGHLRRLNGLLSDEAFRPCFRTMYRLHQMVQIFLAAEA